MQTSQETVALIRIERKDQTMARRRGHLKGFLAWVFVPLCLVLAATIVSSLLGYKTLSSLIGQFGTIVVLAVAGAYIVFRDSKSRWPNASAFQRFANVLTFKRN